MILSILKSSLIVSCQAPSDSPLYQPEIMALMAKTAVYRGAKGVRIDSPSHIEAVRQLLPDTPIIGLWKQTNLNSSVYITPRFADAVAVSEAGADIIAIDATNRSRPDGEDLGEIISKIKTQLGKLVMADVDTLDNALQAVAKGADVVGTTLYGYTEETRHLTPPNFELVAQLSAKLDCPVICEGGIKTPQQAQMAMVEGAFAVVVGTAITGIDLQTQAYVNFLNQ